ncbi:MAG: hypothetical protein MJ093_09580 [Saccharofermentans sp.]|nr:hypothetical protein [Saccharofermentans sp.]
MKMIKEYVSEIDEELKSAEEYAQKYLEYKMDGMIELYNDYKGMAEDELRHAMILHKIAENKIDQVSKVYNPPMEMMNKWREAHMEYVARADKVKSILEAE